MERDKMESMLIDYIDGRLRDAERHYVEQELIRNPQLYRLYEELKEVIQTMNAVSPERPSERLKVSFDAMISRERAAARKRVSLISPLFYRVAAGLALLVVGVSLGFWYSSYRASQREQARLSAEREQIAGITHTMTSDVSAARRILAVNSAPLSGSFHKEIIDALVKTLNEDNNANVRLAALEALNRFRQEPAVRKALVGSLSVQKDPVVQITLIQVLVDMKEKDALKSMHGIAESQDVIPAVRDEAHRAILILS